MAMKPSTSVYAIGLGSNRPHGRYGGPERVIAHAVRSIGALGRVIAVSRIRFTAPVGPSTRRFANAALLIECPHPPPVLLQALKRIERDFGRRRGRRWGGRVLDLDILLWSNGRWRQRSLTVPHAMLTERRFVLDPLGEIAADWRLPGSALAVRHIAARRRAVDRGRGGP